MEKINSRRCARPDCSKIPFFGVEASKAPLYCREHAEAVMMIITSRRCARRGCSKVPFFGVEGSKVPLYCRQHAEAGSPVRKIGRRGSGERCYERIPSGDAAC